MRAVSPPFLFFIFLSFGISVGAAEFEIERLSNGILVTPDVPHNGVNVRLVGPGGSKELNYLPGNQVFIPTPENDGAYRFELVLSPVLTIEQRSTLSQVRNNPGTPLPFDGSDNVMTWSFVVAGGEIADWLLEEQVPTGKENLESSESGQKVVLTNSDGIIRFSACIGGDCQDAPAFGSDTLRLRENNLRIHYDDTSTGSFPGNDWRLVGNESINGGANYFAVQDASQGAASPLLIFAGAPNNSLVVENTGDIGINTATPVLEVHVRDGDSPGLRLEQDGSGGFQAQTFDVVGNETNFFIRDITNGSLIPFVIKPGADDDTLFLDADGQVGIGTRGVMDSVGATLQIRARNVGTDPVLLAEASNGDDLMTLADTGDMTLSGTLAQLSRRDSKEGFESLEAEALLGALRELPITRWNYKHQSEEQRHLGPMAEDFFAAYGLGSDPEHIATSDMAAVALASTQALLTEIDKRDAHIAELEQRLADLERMVLTVMLEKEQDTTPVASR